MKGKNKINVDCYQLLSSEALQDNEDGVSGEESDIDNDELIEVYASEWMAWPRRG